RALEPHRARQLVGPGDHGGELVQRCKRGGTPARAAVQGAHEPALVLVRGGGLEPPATHGDGGGPGLLDADFGEVGAGGGERRGEPVDQPPSSLSFSAEASRTTIAPKMTTSRTQGRRMKLSVPSA